MAVPGLVQHIASDINNTNVGGPAGNGYILRRDAALAGNCLYLFLSYAYSASRTVSISDSSGQTWPAAATTVTDGANIICAFYALPNATAGFHDLTITFDAAVRPFQYTYGELYNIATSSPVDGTKTASALTSSPYQTGSFTPTTNNDANGGHIILCYLFPNDPSGSEGAASAMSVSGSGSLLHANNLSTNVNAASYFVQSTNGAINPGFNVTQSSPPGGGYNLIAVALKAASAGNPPPNQVRVVRLLHQTWYPSDGTFTRLMPCDGNLLIAQTVVDASQLTMGSVSDTNSNSYVNGALSSSYPFVFYATGATPSNNNKITFTLSAIASQPAHLSMRFFDIANAGVLDNAAGNPNGTAVDGSGTIDHNNPVITPNSAPGISIVGAGLATGPGTGMASGAPSGAVFDLVYWSGQTDADQMDNSDCVGHVRYTTTATQDWNWGITSASNGSDTSSTALTFTESVQPVVSTNVTLLPHQNWM
jgi:hypothetical protein